MKRSESQRLGEEHRSFYRVRNWRLPERELEILDLPGNKAIVYIVTYRYNMALFIILAF